MTTPPSSSFKPKPPPDYIWPTPELYIYQILFSVMVIAIVLLNITVIIGYGRMARLVRRKIPNMLLLNQALVDLLIGLSSVFRIVCSSHKCSEIVNNIKFFFFEYTTFLAIGVLLVGTLERYVSVKVPFHHHRYVTKGKVVALMVCTWAVTMLPSLIHSTYVFPLSIPQLNKNYYIGTYTVLLLALLVVFIILGVTYREIRASISRRLKQEDSSAKSPATVTAVSARINREEESQKKLTRMFLFMSIAYLVTIAPQIIGSIVLDAVLPKTKEAHDIINTSKSAFHLIYIVSSFINPMLTLTSNNWRRLMWN